MTKKKGRVSRRRVSNSQLFFLGQLTPNYEIHQIVFFCQLTTHPPLNEENWTKGSNKPNSKIQDSSLYLSLCLHIVQKKSLCLLFIPIIIAAPMPFGCNSCCMASVPCLFPLRLGFKSSINERFTTDKKKTVCDKKKL